MKVTPTRSNISTDEVSDHKTNMLQRTYNHLSSQPPKESVKMLPKHLHMLKIHVHYMSSEPLYLRLYQGS
jgi:hypothetical protein